MLKNKKIIVAVTGSVAAYKSIELIREFKRLGAVVRAVLTPDATRFVTPLSLQIASENEAIHDMFSHPLSHIELPKWGDAMVVAPATANTVSKFFSAAASDMVSACFLAFQGPVVIAPAMNGRMYTDRIFQERLHYLKEKGVREVTPESGSLACGEEGIGRMASLERIIQETAQSLLQQDFAGKRIVVTAGPTREYLDPVRFLSNRSSGKMGFSIARCSFRRGADVALVAGPTSLGPPAGILTKRVETAVEMRDAVLEVVSGADVLIMTAAVADYTPRERSQTKIDKQSRLVLELSQTPDIIAEVSRLPQRPFIVGFAAETGDNRARAKEKMVRKGMDMVVFNNVSMSGSGFDSDANQVVLIDAATEEALPLLGKDEVAMLILDRIAGKIP
ncbi:MAG: bifunctional phosphopantothenoylcysteine decarboxylase/phosphopantothenate--cysteine ligase CoaBC [bacterium]